jgi:hypothetical protein
MARSPRSPQRLRHAFPVAAVLLVALASIGPAQAEVKDATPAGFSLETR